MNTVIETKKLEMSNWRIVSSDSQQQTQLELFLCAGMFFYPISNEAGPYLVIHSGPFCSSDMSDLINAIFEVRNAHEFNEVEGSKNKISLDNILEIYQNKLGQKQPLGVYMASGSRANSTDKVLASSFMLDPGYELMGAELNMICQTTLNPAERAIHVLEYTPGPKLEHFVTYNFGKKYNLNFRPS